MFVTMTIRPLIALSAMLLPCVAQAQTAAFENINTLEARLTAALGADIGTPGGPAQPIDRRLKLARCPSPATIDPPALGAIAIRCEPIGWRIRVPLQHFAAAAGMQTAAKADPVVRKGDPVELFVETRTFSVSTGAIAQEDGAMGDRIRVRSDAKSPIMIAEVVDGGRVRVPGFK
jgi:flagella basal body P-ring formation protein FlgA